uniref:Uncharacterized protein n=1 Tax=Oryza meridionalis TaxID=40149 RepID=A0A0E0DHY1_9ORYZ
MSERHRHIKSLFCNQMATEPDEALHYCISITGTDIDDQQLSITVSIYPRRNDEAEQLVRFSSRAYFAMSTQICTNRSYYLSLIDPFGPPDFVA